MQMNATNAASANFAVQTLNGRPDFALADEDGGTVRLSDYRGKRVVVFFYPKAMTSG